MTERTPPHPKGDLNGRTNVRNQVVVEDPGKGAVKGTVLDIRFLGFPPLIANGFADLKEWDYFGTVLIGISFHSESGFRPDGSAVLIGPGVALAAKHVFEPVMDDIMASKIVPLAYSVTPESLVLWAIHQIIQMDNDVVVLRLDMRSPLPAQGLAVATMTTRSPALGEAVMIVGIRGTPTITPDDPTQIQFNIGVGEVTSLYHEGRDRVILPHPCLEVGCLSVGGMSGGPAFDKHGNLLGILTSSFEDDRGPSYISLWWPLAAAKIETSWLPGAIDLPTSILAMQQTGIIKVIRPEALLFDGIDTLRYDVWT